MYGVHTIERAVFGGRTDPSCRLDRPKGRGNTLAPIRVESHHTREFRATKSRNPRAWMDRPIDSGIHPRNLRGGFKSLGRRATTPFSSPFVETPDPPDVLSMYGSENYRSVRQRTPPRYSRSLGDGITNEGFAVPGNISTLPVSPKGATPAPALKNASKRYVR